MEVMEIVHIILAVELGIIALLGLAVVTTRIVFRDEEIDNV